MIGKNCTVDQLFKALDMINASTYDGNIIFKRIDQISKSRIRFTLTVKNSRGKGGRVSTDRERYIAAACWHAHGHFFDALFTMAPDATIETGNGSVDRWSNWRDYDIGSHAYPCMYSDACLCD